MEIYNQLPEELQNKVFYFMSHPCADMIKSSLHFNPKEYIHPYFLISKKIKFWNQFWINNKDESWWDGLKDKIRRDRERYAEWKERKLMDKNDYDAETGRTVNDDSDDDSDDESSEDDSESSEDNNSDDSESESSEGNRNDNESESSEGDNNDNDNESVSSDPDPDDEYAECANDPELKYLFISEWQEFDHYDPYYAYLD